MNKPDRSWQALGTPAPTELTDARLQAHWAVQLIAGAADSLLEHRDDDRHTILRWDPDRRVLIGERLGSLRVALRIANLDLLVLDDDGLVAQMMLNDRRLDEARDWLTGALRSNVRRGDASVRIRDYDLPDHPVREGARFKATDSLGLNELGRWFANAGLVLGRIAGADERCSAPAIWPHHFDAGAVLTIEGGRTIGFGMSPGDSHVAEPYFYVVPSPFPEGELPELPGGATWQRDRVGGAVLTGTAIVADEAAEAQQARADRFLRAAIDACLSL
jgi:hypothetical protein